MSRSDCSIQLLINLWDDLCSRIAILGPHQALLFSYKHMEPT